MFVFQAKVPTLIVRNVRQSQEVCETMSCAIKPFNCSNKLLCNQRYDSSRFNLEASSRADTTKLLQDTTFITDKLFALV